MLSHLISTLVALVFIVQPLKAGLCAADCEKAGSPQTKSLPAEHCAIAAAQPAGLSEAQHSSTERPIRSSQDSSDCEHSHGVCVAVAHSRAELNAPPVPVLAPSHNRVMSLSTRSIGQTWC